jgi:plastocyanin
VRARILLLALLACPLGACKDDEDISLRPDALLRDSLGLGDEDRVHRVQLASSTDGGESADPATLEVRPGDWVEFVTSDRRIHVVSFALDGLPEASARFLIESGQQGSPPLMDPGTRFVVSFAGAPLGRYPFEVIGNGRAAQGAVVVADPAR